MTCPKCGSNDVSVQVLNESKLVTAHHGIIWWMFIGWWLFLIKWLIFTVPAIIFKIFGIGKNKKIINKTKKVNVCQKCGNTF